MKARRCVGQLARGQAFAGKARGFHRLYPLHGLGHGAQFCGRAVAQPQAPALVAVQKFVGTQPAAKPFFAAGLLGDEGVALGGAEQVVAIVDGLVADADLGHSAQRSGAPVQHHVGRVHQIRVDVVRGHGQRLALDVFVLVNHLAGQVLQAKADDDAMHGGLAPRLVAPTEGAVRKLDVQPLRQ